MEMLDNGIWMRHASDTADISRRERRHGLEEHPGVLLLRIWDGTLFRRTPSRDYASGSYRSRSPG